MKRLIISIFILIVTAVSVIAAEKPDRLKIMTYNLRFGELATMKEIASILKTLNVKMTYAEENSMGAIDIELIKKDWKKVTSFQTSNTSKRDIVENVIVMFEQGEGTLFDTQEVRTQFSSFIQDKTKGGKITYHNVRDDIHDDYVISYCLAQWARKQYETRGKYNIA